MLAMPTLKFKAPFIPTQPGYQEQLGDAETKIAQYSQEIVVLKEKLNGSLTLQESVANQKEEIETLKRDKSSLEEKCHQVRASEFCSIRHDIPSVCLVMP